MSIAVVLAHDLLLREIRGESQHCLWHDVALCPFSGSSHWPIVPWSSRCEIWWIWWAESQIYTEKQLTTLHDTTSQSMSYMSTICHMSYVNSPMAETQHDTTGVLKKPCETTFEFSNSRRRQSWHIMAFWQHETPLFLAQFMYAY